MKQNIRYTILGVLGISLLIGGYFFLVYLYKTGNATIKKKADKALEIAVDKELESRFSKLNMPYTFTPSGFSDFKKLAITTEDGEIVYELDKEKEKDAITANVEKRTRQTFMLLEKQPIVSIHLDSIWRVELLNNKISAKTVICIKTPLDASDVNCSNSHSFNDSKVQQVYYAGLVHEMEISSGFTCGLWAIISNGDLGSWRTYLIVFLILAFSFFIAQRRLFNKKTKLTSVTLEEKDITYISGAFKIGDAVFDSSRKKLIKGQEEIAITSQMRDLLNLFLNKPDYYLSEAEIIDELWGKPEIGSKNRLQKSISNLRKILSEHLSGITIEFKDPGYKLCSTITIVRM